MFVHTHVPLDSLLATCLPQDPGHLAYPLCGVVEGDPQLRVSEDSSSGNTLCAVDFSGHFSPNASSNDLGIKLLLGINNWLGLMGLTASWDIIPTSH